MVYYSAREIYKKLRYSRWEKFERLIRRSLNLIKNNLKEGYIRKTQIEVFIGSGAKRKITDYLLDEKAFNLVCEMVNSYKLNKSHLLRNETLVLSQLKKYCNLKKIKFEFQYQLGPYFFDCRVGNILIEFDELHHEEKEVSVNDKKKNEIAKKNKYHLLRFTLEDDIIDIIYKISVNLKNK